jgi:hypothetical protein
MVLSASPRSSVISHIFEILGGPSRSSAIFHIFEVLSDPSRSPAAFHISEIPSDPSRSSAIYLPCLRDPQRSIEILSDFQHAEVLRDFLFSPLSGFYRVMLEHALLVL